MKAELTIEGKLKLVPGNSTEAFAAAGWAHIKDQKYPGFIDNELVMHVPDEIAVAFRKIHGRLLENKPGQVEPIQPVAVPTEVAENLTNLDEVPGAKPSPELTGTALPAGQLDPDTTYDRQVLLDELALLKVDVPARRKGPTLVRMINTARQARQSDPTVPVAPPTIAPASPAAPAVEVPGVNPTTQPAVSPDPLADGASPAVTLEQAVEMLKQYAAAKGTPVAWDLLQSYRGCEEVNQMTPVEQAEMCVKIKDALHNA